MRNREPWLALGWGTLAALAALSVLGLEPNLLEEGIPLHIAERLAHGERLYRDIVFFTGPLPYELLALLFRAFGEELMVARLALLPLVAAAAASAFALARAAGAGPFAHAVAAIWVAAPVLLFPLLSVYFYTTFAFDLIPVAALLAWRGWRSPGAALGAGLLVSAIALSKQSFGAPLSLGFLIALATLVPAGRRARASSFFAAGGVLATLFTIAVYGARGELGALVDGLARLPLELDRSYRAPYLNLWPPGRISGALAPNATLYLPIALYFEEGVFREVHAGWVLLAQALYALPLLALLASALRLTRLGAPRSLALGLGAISLLTVLANLFPRGDWGHLVFTLPLAAQQLLLAAAARRERATPHGRVARGASAALCALLLGSGLGFALWLHALSWPIQYFGDRVPLHVVSPTTKMPTYPRVIAYLRHHARPGEPIFVARQEPLLYFATGTTNPTPYVGILLARRQIQQERILGALGRIRLAVMSDLDQPLYAYYSDELPRVWDYLERHFEIPADFPIDHNSFAQVLARGRDRGATLYDFGRERARGRPFVRDGRGELHPTAEAVPRMPAQQLRRPFAISLGAKGGGVDFELELPERGARLQADVGIPWLVSLEGRHDQPAAAEHRISISRDGARFEPIARVRLSTRPGPLRARWSPLEIDLFAYRGERVWLRFELESDDDLEEGSLAWFGSPRLASLPGQSM